jgi:hypothetical protein
MHYSSRAGGESEFGMNFLHFLVEPVCIAISLFVKGVNLYVAPVFEESKNPPKIV